MKLKRVDLLNWRSLKQANCPLGNVNFIFGKNNEGKSSLVYGVEYALTNKSSISSDISVLQRTESDECSTLVELEGLGTIQRYKKTSNQMNRLNGEKSTDKEIIEQILQTFDLSYETIGIMFDASRFTKMDKKQQKAFLLKLMGISLNADKIIEYMDNPSEEAKRRVRLAIQNMVLSIDDITDIYKEFYSDRTAKKKEVVSFENEIKVLKDNSIKDKPRQMEYIKNDIEKIGLAIKEIEKTLTIYNERAKQKETLVASIQKGKENYKIVEDKISKDIPQTRDAIDDLEKQTNILLEEKSKNDKEVGTYDAIIKNCLSNTQGISVDTIMNDSNIELVEDVSSYENMDNRSLQIEKEQEFKMLESTSKQYLNDLAKYEDNSTLQTIFKDASLEVVEDVEVLLQENKDMEEKRVQNSIKVASLKSTITTSKSTIEKLNTTTCPLSKNITCTYDKQPMIKELQTSIDNAEKEIKALEKENLSFKEKAIQNIKTIIKTNLMKAKALKAEIAKLEEKKVFNNSIVIKFYKTKLIALAKRNEEIVLLIEENKKKRTAIENQIKYIDWLENAKKELDIREQELKQIELPKIDGLVEKKEELENSKNSFEQEKKFAEKYIEEQKLIATKEKSFSKAKEDLALLEYLVAEFAPNGVRSRVLEKLIAPVVEIANERLKILTNGYSIEFNFDKDFDIYVTNKTGKLLFEQLSVSEQLRIQVIIQDAINQLVNVGLMVVDEAGILDNDNFIMLMDLVKEIAPSYGNIFIIATKEKAEVVELSPHLYKTSDDVHIYYIEKNEVFKM